MFFELTSAIKVLRMRKLAHLLKPCAIYKYNLNSFTRKFSASKGMDARAAYLGLLAPVGLITDNRLGSLLHPTLQF